MARRAGDLWEGLIVEWLELQPQFLGQRFIRGFHEDRSIWEDDGRDAAHASIGCLHELFGFNIPIDIDKIIRDVILVQVSSGSPAISAPVGSIYLDGWVCHADAPVCRDGEADLIRLNLPKAIRLPGYYNKLSCGLGHNRVIGIFCDDFRIRGCEGGVATFTPPNPGTSTAIPNEPNKITKGIFVHAAD
jgi:hypothetical protein